MPDQSVVEELLEKGARAGAVALANVANLPEWMQVRALGRDMTPIAQLAVEAAFDAVFPGWREGITREWTCNHRSHLSNSFEGARWLAERDEGCDPVYTRVVVTSAWVPVEEGTGG